MASPGKRRRKKAGKPAEEFVQSVEVVEVAAPKITAPKPRIKPKKRKGFFDKD